MDALPWRLAAGSALAVMILGLAMGVDLWITLARAGAAFVLFWLLGAAGRALLGRPGGDRPASRSRSADRMTDGDPGEHPDETPHA